MYMKIWDPQGALVISGDSDDPDGSDGGIDLDLEEESGSLLNYLWARRENMMGEGVRSVLGLSFDAEIAIYDCLILGLHHTKSERSHRIASWIH